MKIHQFDTYIPTGVPMCCHLLSSTERPVPSANTSHLAICSVNFFNENGENFSPDEKLDEPKPPLINNNCGYISKHFGVLIKTKRKCSSLGYIKTGLKSMDILVHEQRQDDNYIIIRSVSN